MSVTVAAELQPSRCVIVAVRRHRREPPEVLAGASFANSADLADRLREFRRGWQLPARLRLVLWPRIGDAGVTPIAHKPTQDVKPQDAEVMRDRARAVVQAGFLVTSVTPPHRALALLASEAASSPTIVLALEREIGCAVVATGGRVDDAIYLSWPALRPRDDPSAMALARYQFGAQLAPQVRHLIKRGGGHIGDILACGSLADLRVQVVPLIEEIDHEVQVLDAAFSGVSLTGELSDAASLAAFQVAVAAAASAKALGLGAAD